jgi:demethylmenaquinone methyltransferase/2-methoxy-6-polyprenyl-1,4-benzoquinol methylase
VTRATLDKDPAEVAAMFDEVAARYDLTNTVLSLGQDRGWRTAVPGRSTCAGGAGARPRGRHATSSAALARPGPTSSAATSRSACCASGRRPARGRRAGRRRRPALPFADGSFDAVTISFGLRNTADADARCASCCA